MLLLDLHHTHCSQIRFLFTVSSFHFGCLTGVWRMCCWRGRTTERERERVKQGAPGDRTPPSMGDKEGGCQREARTRTTHSQPGILVPGLGLLWGAVPCVTGTALGLLVGLSRTPWGFPDGPIQRWKPPWPTAWVTASRLLPGTHYGAAFQAASNQTSVASVLVRLLV